MCTLVKIRATFPFLSMQKSRASSAVPGWLADLPDRERLPLLAEVRSLLDAENYERHWETHVHWARLRAN